MRKVCRRCGTRVRKERDKDLKRQYPYYCPKCDENMFEFEVRAEKEE
ncbi:MAG: hypothetical protein NC123_08545 [Butyrivibrio sp.]|nr:hypothetical protein [Butyrivibrio sp.]